MSLLAKSLRLLFLDPWDMHITEFPLQHGFMMKAFYCQKNSSALRNFLGCSDEDFDKICEIIEQSHMHFIQMISDFLLQFNAIA